jgi:hypothetical protein
LPAAEDGAEEAGCCLGAAMCATRMTVSPSAGDSSSAGMGSARSSQ